MCCLPVEAISMIRAAETRFLLKLLQGESAEQMPRYYTVSQNYSGIRRKHTYSIENLLISLQKL